MDQRHRERLQDVIRLFDNAYKAYKDTQNLFVEIDTRIQNEFVYASRAKNTILKSMTESDYGRDFELSLQDLEQSARHILNDCLDLALYFAISETRRISGMSKSITISDVYPDYHQTAAIINAFSDRVSETRKQRGDYRINEYLKMVESPDYKKLVSYCLMLGTIENDLIVKNRKDLRNTRRWFFGIMIAILVGIATVAVQLASS